MKPISIITSLLFFSITLSAQPGTVNAVLGDTSWFNCYGEYPDQFDNEVQRINTHLDLVIQKLKSAKAPNQEQQASRQQNIRILEEYRKQQIYPQDFKPLETRTPCFIDDNGRVCAVGYLIEKTAGREEAERINSLFRYDYLSDMKDEGLEQWQKSSGFSTKELAMIQPAYGMSLPRYVFMDPKTKKVGVMDRYTNEVRIKAKYEHIILGAHPQFHMGYDGLEIAKYDGRWGLISGKGKRLTKFVFDSIHGSFERSAEAHYISMDNGQDRSNDFVFAYSKNELSIYNKRGELKFKTYGAWISKFESPYFMVRKDSLFGVLDTAFNWKVKPKYQHVNPILMSSDCQLNNRRGQGGLVKFFQVKGPDGFGLINDQGDEVIPLKHQYLHKIKPDVWAGRAATRYTAYKESGLECKIENLVQVKAFGPCERKLLEASISNTPQGPIKKGVLDSNFKWVVKPEYDDFSFRAGRVAVVKDEKHGIIDLDGKMFMPVEYEFISHRNDGSMLLKINGKLGLLDKDRRPIIPLKFDRLSRISKDDKTAMDCFAACKDGFCQIYDSQGKLISEQKFDTIINRLSKVFMVKLDDYYYLGTYQDGGLLFNRDVSFKSYEVVAARIMAYEENGKFGFWMLNDDILNERNKLSAPLFDEISTLRMYQNQRYIVKKDGFYGIADYYGKIIVEPQFVSFQDTRTGYNPRYSVCFKDPNGHWHRYTVTQDKLEKLDDNQQKKLEKQLEG